MKFSKYLSMAMLAVCPLIAQDQPPAPVLSQYIGLHAGVNHAHLTNQSQSGMKMGYKVGACYGYVFESNFRGELEFGYRKNTFTTKYVLRAADEIKSKAFRSFHSWNVMANILYDLPQLTVMTFVPYVGLGVGYAHNTEKNKLKNDQVAEDSFHDNRFAYQAIVGAEYPVQQNYKLGLRYVYFSGRDHCKDHSLLMNLVRSF